MILLDTHVVLWWLHEPARLSEAATEAIAAAQRAGPMFISAVTGWEIAMLAARKRVAVAGDVLPWFQSLVALPGVRLAALDNEVLIRSTTLPGDFHKDPADRMIVATARKLSVPVISADAWIRAYPHVHSIW